MVSSLLSNRGYSCLCLPGPGNIDLHHQARLPLLATSLSPATLQLCLRESRGSEGMRAVSRMAPLKPILQLEQGHFSLCPAQRAHGSPSETHTPPPSDIRAGRTEVGARELFLLVTQEQMLKSQDRQRRHDNSSGVSQRNQNDLLSENCQGPQENPTGNTCLWGGSRRKRTVMSAAVTWALN